MPTAVREKLIVAIISAVSGAYAIPVPEDEDLLPITIVRDDEDAVETNAYGLCDVSMVIRIGKAAAAASPDRDVMRAQANALLADMIVDMFDDETFGGLADGIDLIGQAINAEIGKFVEAITEFTVRYHHVRGDPFTIDLP